MSSKSEKFLKVNMWISKYLLFALPFIVAIVVWCLVSPNLEVEAQGLAAILSDILSWHFLVWFVCLIYFIMSLVFWGAFREKILTVLTLSKERDERESFISGRASKATFYSTLAVLILLFFLSGLHVHIYRKPKEEAVNGKRGTIYIGYSFSFVNSDKNKVLQKNYGNSELIFRIDGVPFTQESLLLFIILYHVSSYHFFTKRRLGEALE